MWKWLFCINKKGKFFFCIKPSAGVKFIILYGFVAAVLQLFWVFYRAVFAEDSDEQDEFSRVVKCNEAYLGLGFDTICNVFAGHINMFTLAFTVMSVICGGSVAICGLYAWLCGFSFHETERYFYINFVFTIYFQIHSIIIAITLTPNFILPIISGAFGLYIILCLNNLLYCFLETVELKYRRRRELNSQYYHLNDQE
ncbi:unnamed protein product [Moneuplotes crassus]|uniref:Uncharacterized protein n=1 Tax=Euplotes crassus TaxID=5936 RepID=A0AAD1XYC1_EUPCR|nr:unnamed protein product [Moneuplotes crassus]